MGRLRLHTYPRVSPSLIPRKPHTWNVTLTTPPSLLTALTATPPSASVQKAWYHAHLTRRLYRSGADDWPGTKALVLRFLVMWEAARRVSAIPTAVRVEVNGVEIVVDATEAERRGLAVLR